MNETTLTPTALEDFRSYLRREEKSPHTVAKYLRDARAFAAFAGTQPVTKEVVIAYKSDLITRGYAVSSINSMLASLRSLLHFLALDGCRVKSLRVQRSVYCPEEKELTRREYFRLHLYYVAIRIPPSSSKTYPNRGLM